MMILDSLMSFVNNITGLGTVARKAQGEWNLEVVDQATAQIAYRSSWMVRKAVDIPVLDGMREGWAWNASQDQIEKIEAEEQRLRIRQKLVLVQQWARLFGGAALILGDGAQDVSLPLDPDRVRVGGLKYVIPVDRWSLGVGQVDSDPESEFFMRHSHYDITWPNGRMVQSLHPSRVVPFSGPTKPGILGMQEDGWGDSVLQHILEAIEIAVSTQQGIAELVQEAKIDVYRIPELTRLIVTEDYEKRIIRRMALTNQAKSVVNAILLDKEEEYEQKEIQFGRLPEIQMTMLQIVSAAVDIPVTRFLGQSPAGMNATGESDIRNYYDNVASGQELFLRPSMEHLMSVLVPSALGKADRSVWFKFEPLWQMSEREAAEIDKIEAETDNILLSSGIVPESVMEKVVRNRLIERGLRPGVEEAYEEWDRTADPEESEEPEPTSITGVSGQEVNVQSTALNGAQIQALQGIVLAVANEEIPADTAIKIITVAFPSISEAKAREIVNPVESELSAKPSVPPAAALPAEGDPAGLPVEPAEDDPRRVGDATPRTLYVRRDVLNASEIAAWAQAQGISDLVDDMHVTIAYSRTPVDWMKVGESFEEKIEIAPGGPRAVEKLGPEQNVTVLEFTSRSLKWRNEEIVEAGATWDWPEYQPHITLTKAPTDLTDVTPYQGRILLGPEIFEEVEE